MTRQGRRFMALVPALVVAALVASPARAWEPSKPIEFVIPAGTGGGADQMARLIAGIVEKHKLSPRPIIVVNKSGARARRDSSTSRVRRVTPTRLSSRSRISSPPRSTPACPSTGRT